MTDDSLRANVRSLSRLVALGGSSCATLALWELHTRLSLDAADRPRTLEAYRRAWAGAFLRALEVEVEVEARVELPDPSPRAPTRARLVVSNHRSLLDVPVLLRHFGGRMLSKAEVATWPVAGPLAKHAETIFVDRADRRSGAKAIRAMRAALRERATLTVFPEGTVHPGDEVRAFQPGAFTAASGLEVEIVPAAVAYAPELEWGGLDTRTHVERLMRTPRSVVGLAIGEPFVAGGSSREVSEAAREAVQALVPLARRRARTR